MITRPDISDYPEFQRKYIALVPDNVMPFLQEQRKMFLDYIDNLTDVQLDHKYAEDKWTIRQVILHIIDTEQVFSYRTLAVSRGDTQNLSGFDQDIYIDNFDYDNKPMPWGFRKFGFLFSKIFYHFLKKSNSFD